MADSDPRVVAFGEVLFDCFPDQVCIGGAPMNFAWYLRQFGIPVAVLSAVGRDELGAEAQRLLRQAGIVSWVAERPEPTGTVEVQLVEGQPDFTINRNVAWEHIEFPPALEGQPELLYFGTAAQLSPVNRATLKELLAHGARHRLYDANLRREFDDPQILLDGLEWATILKLSEGEWETVRRLTRQDTPGEMLEHFGLEILAVTRGSEGAELYVPGGEFRSPSPRVEVADTVGAGDGFCAALTAGVLQGMDPEETLQKACEVGAFVAQQRGGQVELPMAWRRAFGEEGGA